ncbi:hypothetical protein CBU02nite_16720 [Clostridium butyricum]|jgi:O-antigen/teichoic acid export membrane protein|uniref:Oligosaccharide flippase family protein n=1 Tax=Clostridium butyricum TaxID=1492 RepID=A0A512TLQ9_CLOBU|nr:flippase [Clostridium butyricum]NAS17093.1 oligosaccharide flippase family protein [Clostridium butyricum]NOW22536.1 O-antigen/teichoic acid export membrane protein [Clostridium butyricum]GEQ21166.1 hypothetical protein CBU02nite_16720 [Clostridium butyricum]
MSKSLSKNFFYNLFYQVVTLFSPLITVPYVSRILGKNGIGIYSYTGSITQYFILLGTLGICTYGNRQIAYVRDNKENMSKTFWSITLLKATTTLIAFFIYLLVFGFNKEYGYIYLIQSINILAATFDISWFYMGLEDFKKTVTRNLIVKIICIISIFIFIQTPNDLSKYLLINVLMALLGNLVMWMYIPNIVSKVNINFEDIISHFYPTLKLFIPQIAVQIYSILDRTQLGILSNVSEVGLYEQSQKIIRLVLGLLTCTSAVMLPRMSNIFAHGDFKKMNRYLNTSLKATSYICIPMAFGLIGISKEFVPWFFGKDFLDVSYLLVVLTPILFFIGMSSIMGNQYLLPSNQTKVYTISVTSGSIINVILNFILIPKFQAIGTCISSIVAEFTVMFIQYIILRKNIDIKNLSKSISKYIISSTIMLIVVRLIGLYMQSKVITTVVQIIVGSIIYILSLLILKEEINLNIFKTVFLKLRIRIFQLYKY